MEIERKFLLAALPPREELGRGELCRQAYLYADDPEMRVRARGRRFYFTVKRGSGLSRDVAARSEGRERIQWIAISTGLLAFAGTEIVPTPLAKGSLGLIVVASFFVVLIYRLLRHV